MGIKSIVRQVFGQRRLPEFKVGSAVQFMYNGEARNVKIEKVWEKSGETLVNGHDFVHNGFRTFKVSKMTPLMGRIRLGRRNLA